MEGGPSIQDAENSINSSGEEEETTSGCVHSLCHPRGTLHRFVALFFMCFLGFGSYFCYDNPAALEDHLKRELNITTTEYSLLYSMYSWPNTVLCFVGGYLLDRIFGIRLGTNIYMGVTLVGQILFAFGVSQNTFWLMVVGRFVFGVGAESLAVGQNNYAVLWFKGKELNMVFGLQLCLARIGSAVNFFVMESLYNWVNKKYHGAEALGIVLFLATLTCLFSMACSIILGIMDKRAETILRRNEGASGEVIKLSDLLHFSGAVWVVSNICVFYYVAIFPFISFGKGFFKHKFPKLPNERVNFINSLVYLAGVISPILGLLVDLTGRNLTWITVAIIGTMGAHSILAFTYVTPYVGTIWMGIAYACLASSLWPLISLIVPEHQLGTAYGICQAVQNLGLAIFAIVAGTIVDKYGYTVLEIFFLSSLGVSLLLTFILWIMDSYKGGILNMTPAARQSHQQLVPDAEERATLLAPETGTINDGLQPSTDFQIRNRYLSRIGAPLPDHYSVQNKGLSYKALR